MTRHVRFAPVTTMTIGALSLLVAGCVSQAPAPAPAAHAPSVNPNFVMPTGTGCAGEIARFRAVLASDLETGNVARSVYDRVSPDLARADKACAAGRDGEAIHMVSAAKSRIGYR